jgi:hypothetical protein
MRSGWTFRSGTLARMRECRGGQTARVEIAASKLYPDGTYDEVFNGPGDVILQRSAQRKGLGKQLLSFPSVSFGRSLPMCKTTAAFRSG